MPTPSKNNRLFLDFEELSKAFIGKPKEFITILKMINEDFISNHMLIMDAISDSNLDAFKKIHHNLRGNIILFKIPGFPELMEKIEKSLTSNEARMNKSIKEEVHEEFNLIFQALENKIKEINA